MVVIYRFLFIVFLLVALSLSSCAGFEPTLVPGTASPTPILQITPYWTPTSSATPISTTPAASPTVTPLPTPTPFTHTIVQGDMLGGIALQYSLTVEDLLAANPDVDPGFLKIGSTLVVPLEVSELIVEATPAPIPIQAGEPDCYPTSDGGAYCLMLATNQGQGSVENISARISLFSKDGESVADEIALPPLNILHAGESLPVLAFLPAPFEPDMNVHGEVISALPLLDENIRYLNAEVELEEVIIDPDGIKARVQGRVVIPAGSPPPGYLWLAAVAYGATGEVTGVRKWEAPLEQSCPDLKSQAQTEDSAGVPECLSFDFTVFSLGPEIDRVEVYAEAGYQTVPEEAP